MNISLFLKNVHQNVTSSTLRAGLTHGKIALTTANKKLFLAWLKENQYESDIVKPALSHLLAIATHFSKKMEQAEAKKNIEALAVVAIICYEWLDDGIYKMSPNMLADYEKIMQKAQFYLKKIDYQRSALILEKHFDVLTQEDLKKHLSTVKEFKTLVEDKYKAPELHTFLSIPSLVVIKSIISKAEGKLHTSDDDAMDDSEEEFRPQGRNFSRSLIIFDDIDTPEEPMDCSEVEDETILPAGFEEDSETDEEDDIASKALTNNPFTLWSTPQSSSYPLEEPNSKIACFLEASARFIAMPMFRSKFTSMIADFFLYKRDACLKSNQFIKNHGKSFQPLLNSLKLSSMNSTDAHHAIEMCLKGLKEKLALTLYSESFEQVMDNLVTYLMAKMKASNSLGLKTAEFCNRFEADYNEVLVTTENRSSL